MNDIPYQNIFDALQEVLPRQWHKVVFCVEYGESSYSMKYFVDLGDGEYIECFKLDGIPKHNIIRSFALIDSLIMPARRDLTKKDTWSVMTLSVDENGNLKADYEYDDISEEPIEYHNIWKKKHLR